MGPESPDMGHHLKLRQRNGLNENGKGGPVSAGARSRVRERPWVLNIGNKKD